MTLGGVRYDVEFNAFVPAGKGFVIMDAFRGAVVVYRHPSEYALHVSGASWHCDGGRCPTWSDATECRCMLGAES